MGAFPTIRIAVNAIWLALLGALFLMIAGFGAVQTIRLEGLKVWPVSFTGWIETAEDRQRTIDDLIEAQAAAKAAALAERLKTEERYRAIARRIDDDAQNEIDAALRAADRFIAAGGLRSEDDQSQRCAAGTGAGDHRAEDPDRSGRTPQLDAEGADRLAQRDEGTGERERPGDGFVLVSAADVRICTVNTVKAEAGHQLATRLETASQGQTQTE